MQVSRLAQALDGEDLAPFGLQRQHHATVHGLAVHQHRATAAVPGAASLFRAGQPQVDAQGVQQAVAGGDFRAFRVAVEGEAQALFFHGGIIPRRLFEGNRRGLARARRREGFRSDTMP